MDISAYPNMTQGEIVRLTRVDDCGVPVPALQANRSIMTEGWAMMDFSFDYDDGSEILLKTANSKRAAYAPAKKTPKGVSGTLKFIGQPTPIFEMVLGGTPLAGGANGETGFVTPSAVTDSGRVQLELWGRKDASNACSGAGTSLPFYKYIFPHLFNWAFDGSVSIAEGSAVEYTLSFVGLETQAYAEAVAGELPVAGWAADIQGGGPLAWHDLAALPVVPAGVTYDP